MSVKKKRILIAVAALSALALPLMAVFNERDLGQTLHVLRYELEQDYSKMVSSQDRMTDQFGSQRQQMISIMKRCNELSLMLYSQHQDFTFDLSYALESVTKEYEEFNAKRMPYDRIVGQLDIEIERYSRLLESLRRLPPQIEKIEDIPDSLAYHNDSLRNFVPQAGRHPGAQPHNRPPRDPKDTVDKRPFILDEEGQVDRDSCISYATALLKMYATGKERLVRDSTHYEDVHLRLKESYDYAQERYKVLQNRIFKQGQTPWPTIAKSFGKYWERAAQDVHNKYSIDAPINEENVITGTYTSEWRGPAFFAFVIFQFLGLLGCVLIGMLLIIPLPKVFGRLRTEEFKQRRMYYALLLGILLYVIIFASSVGGHSFLKVASSLVATYVWLLAAILVSLLIRLAPEQLSKGLRLYLPMMVLAVLIIGMRIIFMPNRMMNILLPPVLLAFFVWQLIACMRCCPDLKEGEKIAGWLSLAVIATSLVLAFLGYIFIALLVLVWWFFQLASIQTITAIWHLTERYRERSLEKRIREYKKRITFVGDAEKGNFIIGATWFYDLVKMTVLPVMALLSIPLSLKLALGVFDFSDLYNQLFVNPFINFSSETNGELLRLSGYSIIAVACWYFVFKYIRYVAQAIYMRVKYASFMHKYNRNMVRSNEINISLGKSVISVIVWFIYIVLVVVMLKLPTGSLTVIAGGLSAGIGLAMKDVLNNFIYGIQLMSGRLRVGDWIECGGVRGRVTSIGYQSTQIETLDGAVMSFLNSSLFSSNFVNLTRNNSYEFLKITVGVSYGSDVQKVREVLVEAMQSLRTKDAYGREIVRPDKGIYVVFGDFGDSSVDIAIKQYVLVPERIGYIDRAKEVIYNALNGAGIEIPFPQRDIHIKAE